MKYKGGRTFVCYYLAKGLKFRVCSREDLVREDEASGWEDDEGGEEDIARWKCVSLCTYPHHQSWHYQPIAIWCTR